MKEGAYGVVQDGNKVLLILRCDTPVWVIPGGGIEDGETPEEACVRELKEETGLDVVVTRKVAHYTASHAWTSGVHIFKCERVGGALSKGAETRDLGYYVPDEVPGHLFSLHRRWIQDAFSGGNTTLQGPLQGAEAYEMVWYLFRHPIISIRHLWAFFTRR